METHCYEESYSFYLYGGGVIMTKISLRKQIRLANYDYSQSGYYFVTVCTHNRQNILCDIVVEGLCALQKIELTELGLQIEKALVNLPSIFPYASIDQYCIMPNHIHCIIVMQNEGGSGNLPLQEVIGRFKSYTTYTYNKNHKTKGNILWQRSFYDHIIRNERELGEIRRYIQENPLKWNEDKYYTE